MNRTGRHSARILTQSSALAFAAVLALSACGTEDSAAGEAPNDAAPSQEQNEALEAEETPEETAEQESTGAAVEGAEAEGTEVKVGAEFTDEETGDVVTIVSAVRNNPTEFYEAADNPDGEMVYIEVQVVPGKKYGGTISASDFYLDSAGEETNYAASASDELEEAGYEYFERAPRRDGEHTGYIPIYVSETAAELKGSYIRPEAKVIGEDKKVPEFKSEFEVPAP